MKLRPWTPREDEVIAASLATLGVKGVLAALPHRTAKAIRGRARRLASGPARRFWHAADDEKLRSLWTGELTVKQIAKRIGRSPAMTYVRAHALGLRGCPDGFEYLHEACARTGFDIHTLRDLLRKADVDIRLSLARPTKRSPSGGRGLKGRHTIVWPADVDAAVADYCEREPTERVAERLGVSRETLRRRLSVLLGGKPERYKHWRVTEDEARRAVAAKMVRTRDSGGRIVGARYEEAKAS